MSLLHNITHWGVSDRWPEDIQGKVALTNKVNLVVLLVNVVLLPVNTGDPAVFAINVGGLLLTVASLAANRLFLINVSRFMTAHAPMILVSLAHGAILVPGESPIASSAVLGLSVVPLSFVLFAPSEGRKIVIASIINFLLFSNYSLWSVWLHREASYQQWSGLDGDLVVLMVGFVAMVSFLYMQLLSNKKVSEKNRRMVETLQQNQRETERTKQELENTLEEVKQAQQEDEKRNWAATGLTKFTEILRSQPNLDTVYDTMLSELVRYVKANQAALFVTQEQEEKLVLNLVACYAYQRKKYLQKTLDIGEGLVGQTYLEAETVRLSDLPPGYTAITSGLGQASPNFLVVVPLQVNGSVEGILEMASFQPLEEYQVAFLEKLGESLASAIINHRTAVTTQRLLEQSQTQSEDLLSQEEEMRQNMEELQATQEEMRRQEQAYLQRIEELEQQLV